MNTIPSILERVRRIRQQRAELADYAEQIEAIEQAEPFDHPHWQGVTDEEGWLQDDLTRNLDQLLSDASAITKAAARQLKQTMYDAQDVRRDAETMTFIWRSNDFNNQVTRKVVWISDGHNLIIIEGKQTSVEVDEWQVHIRYLPNCFRK